MADEHGAAGTYSAGGDVLICRTRGRGERGRTDVRWLWTLRSQARPPWKGLSVRFEISREPPRRFARWDVTLRPTPPIRKLASGPDPQSWRSRLRAVGSLSSFPMSTGRAAQRTASRWRTNSDRTSRFRRGASRFDVLGAPPALEDIAAECVKSVRAIQPHGPYRLGGYCGAGFIVFEMAQQLHAAGQQVEKLIMVDPALVPAMLQSSAGLVSFSVRSGRC